MRASVLLALLVTACVAPTRPPPPPAPAPAPVSPPPPAPAPLADDWRDWPLTPGDWRYARVAGGTAATYGPAGDARLTLRCRPADRRIDLLRAGAASGPLTIRTTSATRAIAVQPANGTPVQVAAVLAATDPLLDAMAFSRGRFVVEQAGLAPLVLPNYAEIGRVIEDCRG